MSNTTTKAMRWNSAARVLFSSIALFAVSFSSTGALAHGGEDHSHDEKPVVETSANPRVEATSELFEIVGIPTGAGDGRLVLYVNDFWSNAPVPKAAIEVTVGDATTKATEKWTAPLNRCQVA